MKSAIWLTLKTVKVNCNSGELNIMFLRVYYLESRRLVRNVIALKTC